MGSFSDSAFKSKLKELNSSQQSIQTISLWAIHHRKHHAKIVQIWIEEFREASESSRKLTLLYFANDVIQNVRKKGPEYQMEFRGVLAEAIENAVKCAKLASDEKSLRGVGRLVTVWRERAIFDEAFLNKLDQIMSGSSGSSQVKTAAQPSVAPTTAHSAPVVTAPPTPAIIAQQPNVTAAGIGVADEVGGPVKRVRIDPADFQAFIKKSKGADKKNEPMDSDEEDYEDPSPTSAGESEAPKLETLLRLIQKLQSAPSANAATRSKIAALPSIITDCDAIDKLTDKGEVSRLMDVAKDGLQVVMEYNKELHQELVDRQAVATELARQLAFHRRIIEEKEKLREDLTQEISARRAFRDRLAIHVDSLPDMSAISGSSSGSLSSSSSFGRPLASSSFLPPPSSKSKSQQPPPPSYSRTTFPLK